MTNISDLDLIRYFPEYKKEIEILLFKDENFREVVKDYLFCQDELENHLQSGNISLANQYKETIKDLEEELLTYLKETLSDDSNNNVNNR